MGTDTQLTDTTPVNRIRVETALSRFPIHRLSRKGSTTIDFTSDSGVQWKVSYNKDYGEPGPHAYKIDTLIVNRRIDEAPRPLPEVIRLGSLREINREMRVAEEDTQTVKRALLQNASAFVSAKISYKPKNARDGREKWREIHYSRYSVIFNGEQLPDGTAADAVYIVLNPPHRKMLNDAEVRPLDYDYLISLSPGAQRFYEQLSFQIYGAIASNRNRAKLRYSEYCLCAPQVRYDTFDAVKKQLFKLHAPHRKSGYITKVDYQQTEDGQGRPDWEMFYTPGPKAFAEYNAFAKRPHRTVVPSDASSSAIGLLPEPSTRPASDFFFDLTRRGITQPKAKALLTNLKPAQDVAEQLEYFDHVIRTSEKKINNPPGLLINLISENAPVPDSFVTNSRRQASQQARAAKKAEDAKKAEQRAAYNAYCDSEVANFVQDKLSAEEYETLYEQNKRIFRNQLRAASDSEIDAYSRSAVHAEIKKSNRVVLLSYEDFSHSLHAAMPNLRN